MSDEHPWGTYEKDPLWSGFAYPVGRDAVEQTLTAAGGHLGALYLSMPKLNPPNDPPIVVRVHQSAEGRAGYFDSTDSASRAPSPIMWIEAVPSHQKQAVRNALSDGFLNRACEWVAEINTRAGLAISLSEQEFYLTWNGADLVESASWSPRTHSAN